MRTERTRSMDDIGINVPAQAPLPLDESITKIVFEHASVTRGEGLRHARRELAKDRDGALRIVLTLLKKFVIPRTEEFLALGPELGLQPECKAGCNACCFQGVEVSIPEAILVSLQVADPADPRYKAVLETAEAVAGLDPDARARTGIPCPLLANGKCSVYDNRPLICRATLSPCAKACYDVLEGKDTALQIYWAPQFLVLGDQAALRGVCKDLNLQHDTVDLVQTVATILRDPSTVARWAAGEHVFAPLPKAKIEFRAPEPVA